MKTSPTGFQACVNALTAVDFDLRTLAAELSNCVKFVTLIVGELDGDLPQTISSLREEIQKGFTDAGIDRNVPLYTVPGAGHICYIDNPSVFLEAIHKTLNS